VCAVRQGTNHVAKFSFERVLGGVQDVTAAAALGQMLRYFALYGRREAMLQVIANQVNCGTAGHFRLPSW